MSLSDFSPHEGIQVALHLRTVISNTGFALELVVRSPHGTGRIRGGTADVVTLFQQQYILPFRSTCKRGGQTSGTRAEYQQIYFFFPRILVRHQLYISVLFL